MNVKRVPPISTTITISIAENTAATTLKNGDGSIQKVISASTIPLLTNTSRNTVNTTTTFKNWNLTSALLTATMIQPMNAKNNPILIMTNTLIVPQTVATTLKNGLISLT